MNFRNQAAFRLCYGTEIIVIVHRDQDLRNTRLQNILARAREHVPASTALIQTYLGARRGGNGQVGWREIEVRWHCTHNIAANEFPGSLASDARNDFEVEGKSLRETLHLCVHRISAFPPFRFWHGCVCACMCVSCP